MFSTSQIYNEKDMKDIIKGESTAKRSGKKKGQSKFGKPHEQPRVAVQRLRAVIGVYLYMKETKINDIFSAQVDRIGIQLENIENSLMKSPRTMEKDASEPDDQNMYRTRIVTFAKWVPQDLKGKWFDYMDNVYENANKKGQAFMKDNLGRLNDEYNDSKMITQSEVDKEKDKDKQEKLKLDKQLREDMKGYIGQLEAQWAKANAWPKPKWNSKAPAAGV